jgi:methionine-rich copper-binding protein CopC
MSFKPLFAAAALLFAASSASTAQAHARLEASAPQAGSVVNGAPQVMRLTFNEALEQAFSKVAVVDGANMAMGLQHVEVDKADPKVLVATLPRLHAGQYRVEWSTVTHDGHKTKGEFTFSVR